MARGGVTEEGSLKHDHLSTVYKRDNMTKAVVGVVFYVGL